MNGPGRVTGVFHAVIVVPDLDEALRFYRDLLGLTVTLRWQHDPAILSALTGYPEATGEAATLAAPDGTEIELAAFSQSAGPPARREALGGRRPELHHADLRRPGRGGGATAGRRDALRGRHRRLRHG